MHYNTSIMLSFGKFHSILSAASIESNIFFSRQAASKTKIHTEPVAKRLPPGFNPPAPFALFIKDFTKDKHGINIGEIAKQASQEWKSLDQAKKSIYKNECKFVGENLRKNYENLSSTEKEALTEKAKESKLRTIRFKRRKIHREIRVATSCPKRPSSSFMIFAKECVDKIVPPGSSITLYSQTMKNAKTLWEKLSASEKEKYESQAKTSFENYKAAITNWKIQNKNKLEELVNTHKPELDQLAKKFRIINITDKATVNNKMKQLKTKLKMKKTYKIVGEGLQNKYKEISGTEKESMLRTIRFRRRKIHREIRVATSCPKRPPNSFMIFAMDCVYKNVPPGSSISIRRQALKDAKTLWENMSASEKEKYESQAKTSFENYKAAITNWKIQNKNKLEELVNTHKPELDQLAKKFKMINSSDIAENNKTKRVEGVNTSI